MRCFVNLARFRSTYTHQIQSGKRTNKTHNSWKSNNFHAKEKKKTQILRNKKKFTFPTYNFRVDLVGFLFLLWVKKKLKKKKSSNITGSSYGLKYTVEAWARLYTYSYNPKKCEDDVEIQLKKNSLRCVCVRGCFFSFCLRPNTHALQASKMEVRKIFDFIGNVKKLGASHVYCQTTYTNHNLTFYCCRMEWNNNVQRIFFRFSIEEFIEKNQQNGLFCERCGSTGWGEHSYNSRRRCKWSNNGL